MDQSFASFAWNLTADVLIGVVGLGVLICGVALTGAVVVRYIRHLWGYAWETSGKSVPRF